MARLPGLSLCLTLLACGGSGPAPSSPAGPPSSASPSPSAQAPRPAGEPQVEPLVAQTLERLRAMAKDSGRFAILLQPGAGPVSERAIKLIREGLASDPRFVWTVASKHDEAPVADANNPGQHVHGVSWRFDPPPRLVLSVGASNGTLRIAAREPGRDPLDGPTNGWLWVLSSPLAAALST